MPSEQTLMEGARQFKHSALAEIYDHYSPGLFRYAYRLLGDAQQAEDCVAETFSRFLRALRSGGGPQDHLQAYLYRVAHNWVTDTYRRQPPPTVELPEDLPAEDENHPHGAVEQGQEQAAVRAGLRLLTDEQRQVVVLRFLEGWSIEDVAATLQKPPGAIKALQHRALEALRKILVKKDESVTNE